MRLRTRNWPRTWPAAVLTRKKCCQGGEDFSSTRKLYCNRGLEKGRARCTARRDRAGRYDAVPARPALMISISLVLTRYSTGQKILCFFFFFLLHYLPPDCVRLHFVRLDAVRLHSVRLDAVRLRFHIGSYLKLT